LGDFGRFGLICADIFFASEYLHQKKRVDRLKFSASTNLQIGNQSSSKHPRLWLDNTARFLQCFTNSYLQKTKEILKTAQ
jgi:hypothetical protein